MPKTSLGKWSVVCILGFVLFLMIFFLLVRTGYRGGDTFLSNPPLAITILVSGICGISAFLTGLISVIKYKERNILVYISTLVGFFVLYFVLGEILSPH